MQRWVSGVDGGGPRSASCRAEICKKKKKSPVKCQGEMTCRSVRLSVRRWGRLLCPATSTPLSLLSYLELRTMSLPEAAGPRDAASLRGRSVTPWAVLPQGHGAASEQQRAFCEERQAAPSSKPAVAQRSHLAQSPRTTRRGPEPTPSLGRWGGGCRQGAHAGTMGAAPPYHASICSQGSWRARLRRAQSGHSPASVCTASQSHGPTCSCSCSWVLVPIRGSP